MTSMQPSSSVVAANLLAPAVPETEQPLCREIARIARLPENARPYADKYFVRTEEILRGEQLNPWVRAQVMIRKGPGVVGGLVEAQAILEKYSALREHGGKIARLSEGDSYDKSETLMTIEAPIQDIVALETMYLGVISADTTLRTDGIEKIDTEQVKARMKAVVDAADGRPVIYFGARHFRYDEDRAISAAAFEAGAKGCSTDFGAKTFGLEGIGTIPHVLENIMAWRYGPHRAVVEATLAFDRHIDHNVPRIALIDYFNREIDDSLATARALNGRLYGVRVDTCGENLAQGALPSADCAEVRKWRDEGVPLLDASHPDAKYWYGNGVTVTGVFALRRALTEAGFDDVKITLSSGFGDSSKVRAFVEAEKILGIRLFDSLGVGGVYDSRSAKMDVVAVGETPHSMVPISKVGRRERANPRLSPRHEILIGE